MERLQPQQHARKVEARRARAEAAVPLVQVAREVAAAHVACAARGRAQGGGGAVAAAPSVPTSMPTPEPMASPTVVQNITYNISDSAISGDLSATAPAAAPPQEADMPPLPEEGLPQGWTMEQWKHYGQQWLEQNGRV